MTHQSGDLPAYIHQPAGCPGLAISVALLPQGSAMPVRVFLTRTVR